MRKSGGGFVGRRAVAVIQIGSKSCKPDRGRRGRLRGKPEGHNISGSIQRGAPAPRRYRQGSFVDCSL